MTRVGYLGPRGTFSEEALLASGQRPDLEPVPLATIHGTVMAVQEGSVDEAIVPIENSIEGSVDVTLDTLAIEASTVRIVGEAVLPIRHCLIATAPTEPAAIELVISHPQVLGQCARFLRTLPGAGVETASSSADAVRRVAAEPQRRWAALGNRLSAQLYGCRVLCEGVEDDPDNETRFVWLARTTADTRGGGIASPPELSDARAPRPFKTSLVFWGRGAGGPGWLVRCLSEFASRAINLTRIESRPRRQGLGTYMFFLDLEGRTGEGQVDAATSALRSHCDEVRILGSYPAA